VRRRRREPARIEVPEWYRVFHPEDWDAPDGQEQTMINGSLRPPEDWPADLHRWHAERRWHQAQYTYRREHPDLAAQELEDIITRRAERRQWMG
jgi:hypothetical protein